MLDKLLCLLVCVVGTVIAQNSCTLFGNVIDIDRACIDSAIGSDVFMSANLTYRLTLLCSHRFDYATCMQQSTAGCDEAPDILDEVVASIGVCDTTNGADQWAAKYLEPYLTYQGCYANSAAAPTCAGAVANQSRDFPFSNEPFKQGLDTLHAFKRLYLSCISEWLEASDNCGNWKLSYLKTITDVLVSNRYFGLYLDSHDINDFVEIHEEFVAQQAHQATLQARDLFREGFPFL